MVGDKIDILSRKPKNESIGNTDAFKGWLSQKYEIFDELNRK